MKEQIEEEGDSHQASHSAGPAVPGLRISMRNLRDLNLTVAASASRVLCLGLFLVFP